MNYLLLYEKLIERARTRQIEGYVEKHHIVPRCIGGTNDCSNLVELTPEEHYLAHLLLIKIYPEQPKLIYAAHMMCRGRSNKLYGWLRRLHASEVAKIDRAGKYNSQYGTMWITDGLKNKKICKLDQVPQGWAPGRSCPKGRKHTEEAKEKIRESYRAREPYRGGHKLSEETKKKMSLSKKGNQHARKNKLT